MGSPGGKGKQLIFRGRQDGDSFLADGCWVPGDYRHFKKLKVWGDSDKDPIVYDFNGNPETIREYEAGGCRVRLL